MDTGTLTAERETGTVERVAITCASCGATSAPDGTCLEIGACTAADETAARRSHSGGTAKFPVPAAWNARGSVD